MRFLGPSALLMTAILLTSCGTGEKKAPPAEVDPPQEATAAPEARSKEEATTPGEVADPGPSGEPPTAVPTQPVGVGISEKTPLVLTLEPASGGASSRVGLNLVDMGLESEIALDCEVDGVTFSLLRYVPALAIQELVAPAEDGESGPPAMRLEIKTARRKWDTWLVPGSRVLGRASLRSAWIEYLPEQPPESRQATEELLLKLYDSEPKIVFEVKRDGRRFLLPAEEGAIGKVDDPQYSVEVLRAFNCFALDPVSGEPKNQDPRPLNPALEVRITSAEGSRTAWLFSHLPEFSRKAEDDVVALRYFWNVEGHPHGRAEVTILDRGEDPPQAHAGHNGSRFQFELRADEPLKLPGLEISLLERIPASRVEQRVLPSQQGGNPAVLVSWQSGETRRERWIPMGTTEEIRVGEAIIWGRLDRRRVLGGGGGLHGHGASAPSRGMPLDHPTLPDRGAPEEKAPPDPDPAPESSDG